MSAETTEGLGPTKETPIMTTTLTPPLGYLARRPTHPPLAAKSVAPRTIRIGVAVAKVGIGLAIVTAALGSAVFSLAAHPVPVSHAVVTPAPHHPTVLGRGSLPALQLPAAAN
jgi:hypothetical protein